MQNYLTSIMEIEFDEVTQPGVPSHTLSPYLHARSLISESNIKRRAYSIWERTKCTDEDKNYYEAESQLVRETLIKIKENEI